MRLYNKLQVDVRFVDPSSFGAALNYFTGSKEHNVILRNIAKKKGLKLSEYGLFKGNKKVAGKTEEEINISGQNRISINTQKFKNGIYIYKLISTDNKIYKSKFVVNKR